MHPNAQISHRGFRKQFQKGFKNFHGKESEVVPNVIPFCQLWHLYFLTLPNNVEVS